jgi:hypothetical protein
MWSVAGGEGTVRLEEGNQRYEKKSGEDIR